MRGACLLSIVLCACGSNSTGSEECDGKLVDGDCVPRAQGCESGELELLDGTCVPVGVPSDGCGEGFTWDDGSCVPILPAEPCAPGTMALPGETACRPVMDCPTERWGGIDGGAIPQWVDASYGGNDSDGTTDRPWTTIAEAIGAAAPGAVIGIAAGTYDGNLGINGKLVHLRGTCPAEVTVQGVPSGNGAPAIVITGAGANGTSLTGLRVTGPSAGVAMSGVQDVVLDRLWLHETGAIGLDVEDPLGAASVSVLDSLIETTTGLGALVLGSVLVFERSVVRGTADDGVAPAGLFATASEYTGMPAALTVDRAVARDNASVGIFAVGSSLAIDASYIARTHAVPEGQGYGVGLQDDLDAGLRGDGVITRTVLSENTLAGINVLASTLRIEATTIADTLPWLDPVAGTPFDGGRGLNVQDGAMGGRGVVEMVASTIARSRGLGLFAAGADLVLADSRIRDSSSAELENGRGASIQPSVHDASGSRAVIQRSRFSNNQQFGLFVGDSELSLEQSEVRGVIAAGELGFGDAVASLDGASLAIVDSLLADSARAGLSLFGSSASLTGSVLSCHPIDIAVQDLGPTPSALEDGGGNRCGCDDEPHDCKASSTDLEPPSPL